MERILPLKNFRTFNAANDIAKEIYDRWVWCNIYPTHLYTISKKVESFVKAFSALDRLVEEEAWRNILAEGERVYVNY